MAAWSLGLLLHRPPAHPLGPAAPSQSRLPAEGTVMGVCTPGVSWVNKCKGSAVPGAGVCGHRRVVPLGSRAALPVSERQLCGCFGRRGPCGWLCPAVPVPGAAPALASVPHAATCAGAVATPSAAPVCAAAGAMLTGTGAGQQGEVSSARDRTETWGPRGHQWP